MYKSNAFWYLKKAIYSSLSTTTTVFLFHSLFSQLHSLLHPQQQLNYSTWPLQRLPDPDPSHSPSSPKNNQRVSGPVSADPSDALNSAIMIFSSCLTSSKLTRMAVSLAPPPRIRNVTYMLEGQFQHENFAEHKEPLDLVTCSG